MRPQTPRDERHTTLAVHSICGGIHGLTKPRQDEGQGEGGREGKKDEGGGEYRVSEAATHGQFVLDERLTDTGEWTAREEGWSGCH